MGSTVPTVRNFAALPTPDDAIWPQIVFDLYYAGGFRRRGAGATEGPRQQLHLESGPMQSWLLLVLCLRMLAILGPCQALCQTRVCPTA